MSIAGLRAMPLVAAAHAHGHAGRYILLFIVVIVLAVGVILLVPRHRDRRPLDETTAPGITVTAVAQAARRHDRPRVKFLAWFALAGVVVYVAVDVLLRFLRPGYSLLYNAESDYGRGPWYWVMDLNFLLRCALSLAVASALSRTVRPDSRLRGGLALLVAWAVCSGLLAFFADDVEGQPLQGSGKVHLALGFIAFVCVAIGTILISAGLRSDPGWPSARNVLLGIAVAGAAAFLLLFSAAGHKHAPGGLYERIFLGLELLWMTVVAARVARITEDRGAASGVTRTQETIPVTRSQGLTTDPRADGTITEGKKELPHGRYGILGLLRSERTKLRTVRSTMWTLGLTVLIGVAIGALSTGVTRANWLTMSPADRAAFDPIGRSLVGVYFGQFTIGVLGVLAVSAEYGTGTIRATFCAAPRRPPVLAAKALVFGAVALVTSEIVAFASFFLGQALLTASAPHATIASPGALRAVAGSGLYLCVIGLFSLGLAIIIRHTAGAISAFAGILLLVPLIVQQLPSSLDNDLARFMPVRIGAEMVSGPPLADTFSPWTGLAVLCAYAAVFLVIGAVVLVKRDA